MSMRTGSGGLYYGLLILSRPMIGRNTIGAAFPRVNVSACVYFNRQIAAVEECDA